MNESTDLPSDFNCEVRLFPLPDLVLFPSSILPLHIFEARYREMTREALAEDQLITMATQMDTEGENDKPSGVAKGVCIGRIIAHEKLVNGRYHLALAGLQRALISHEIDTSAPFRRAIVHLVEEEDEGHSKEARALVTELARSIASAPPPLANPLIEKLEFDNISLATFTDVVAFHLPLTTDVKLQLLVDGNPHSRAHTLLEHLAGTPPEGEHPFPPDFSVN